MKKEKQSDGYWVETTIRKYVEPDKIDALKVVMDAFKVINNALYFNDNADYQTALWEAFFILRPELEGLVKDFDNLTFIED